MTPLFENQNSPKKINLNTIVDNARKNFPDWNPEKLERFRNHLISLSTSRDTNGFLSIPAETYETMMQSFNESEEGLSN